MVLKEIMKILDKYLTRQFLQTIFFGLIAFTLIFVVIDMMENLDDFIDQNVAAPVILHYYFGYGNSLFHLGGNRHFCKYWFNDPHCGIASFHTLPSFSKRYCFYRRTSHRSTTRSQDAEEVPIYWNKDWFLGQYQATIY